MSDIVERLRELADNEGHGGIADIVAALWEAAAEIERLRLQLQQNDRKLDEILERIKKLGI